MQGGQNRGRLGRVCHGTLHRTLLAALLAAGCLDTFGYSGSGPDPSTSDTTTLALPTSGAPETTSTTNLPTNDTSDTSATPATTAVTSDSTSAIDSEASSTTLTASTTTSADTSGTTGDSQGFFFADDDFDAYDQVDRHGAVEAGTFGIRAAGGLGFNGENIAIRDAYNASNPTEDIDMMWLGEIVASITFFHDNLDDDIIGLGLTPATFDESIAQIGPVLVPDTLKYDPEHPTGYPNGRKLTDPVVDITLAALLLDLSVHPLNLFAMVSLNPSVNDVPFEPDFPYLAPPH